MARSAQGCNRGFSKNAGTAQGENCNRVGPIEIVQPQGKRAVEEFARLPAEQIHVEG